MSDFDLLTRDEDALSRMQELFPVSPVVPPTEPSQPAHINNSSTPVTEDLVHSCVTPQKVQRVHETRQSETDRYKCAIKLLPNFFTPAELAMSNTDGNFGKQPLDKTKLHTLKGNLYQPGIRKAVRHARMAHKATKWPIKKILTGPVMRPDRTKLVK